MASEVSHIHPAELRSEALSLPLCVPQTAGFLSVVMKAAGDCCELASQSEKKAEKMNARLMPDRQVLSEVSFFFFFFKFKAHRATLKTLP